jgi:hypothetical protein
MLDWFPTTLQWCTSMWGGVLSLPGTALIHVQLWDAELRQERIQF